MEKDNSLWQAVQCRVCKGDGTVEGFCTETPKTKNSLPGTLKKIVICTHCSGRGYVKLLVDTLCEEV